MGKKNGINMTLPTVADLFSTQEERDEGKRESVRDIPLAEISDFPNHPFKVKMDEEILTFHDNEGTDHGMVGKTFTSRFWVFLNERQIKIQEKGIIKFSNWLCCKKTDVFHNFLTVDSNQLLSGFAQGYII